jgi:acyl-CoA dehydrogenase
VRPIGFIDGTSDFCEVTFSDAMVPDELVLGAIGNGWAQNTAELAYERGGPDRVLSTYGVLDDWLRAGGGVDDPPAQEWLGAIVARYWVLRALSLSIARMADSGRSPVVEAALVKEMATRFEQDVTAGVADHLRRPVSLDSEEPGDRLLARAILTGPSITIRGGTNEILRTVVARALTGVADVHKGDVDPLLVETADRIFADTWPAAAVAAAEGGGWTAAAWSRTAGAGLPWLSLPEEAGGSGGTLLDALEVLYLAGRRAVPLPLAETGILGGWLLTGIGHPLPAGPVSVIPGDPRDTLVLDGSRLRGTAHGVPWADEAEAIVAVLPDRASGEPRVVVVAGGLGPYQRKTNLAGEPRDRVAFDDVEVVAVPGGDAQALRRRGALSRVALIAGALAAASELTQAYTAQRVQFGRPINRFQAVQHHLVTLAQQAALARMALDRAARATQTGFEVTAASLIAATAAAEGAKAAHQAHGAMGMTREYPLQLLTRRLWSWRTEYLSTRDDAAALGAEVLRRGPDALYPMITSGEFVSRTPGTGE